MSQTVTITKHTDNRHVDESITTSEFGPDTCWVEVTDPTANYHAAFTLQDGEMLETVDWIADGVYSGQPDWGCAGPVDSGFVNASRAGVLRGVTAVLGGLTTPTLQRWLRLILDRPAQVCYTDCSQ